MAGQKVKKAKAIRVDEMPEWCGPDVIATLLNKTVRRVQQLAQEGIIHTEVMPGGAVRKYKLADTIAAYIDHIEEQARKKAANGERTKELEDRKLEAEVALKESQGELHRMKTEIAAGKYITVEEAQLDLTRFMAHFKKFATAIPSRVGGIVAGYVDPVEARGLEKDLSKEIITMLRAFVDAADTEAPADQEQSTERAPKVGKPAKKKVAPKPNDKPAIKKNQPTKAKGKGGGTA